MSPQELLSSGLIEAYALGAASNEEQREVERMAKAFPEVRAALGQAQKDLETYAQLHAETPSEKVRERIFAELSGEKKDNVISLSERRTDKPAFAFGRMAAAASIVLLIGSVAFNIYLYNNVSKAHELADANEKQIASLADSLSAAQKRYAGLRGKTPGNPEALASFVDPAQVMMTSVKTDAPDAKATVYWCSKTRTVAVDPAALPSAPDDKQYQLWAMVDGKPMSMGVFEAGPGADLQVLAAVPKAEAFAVTLEKRGGVTEPAGPMIVMAKT